MNESTESVSSDADVFRKPSCLPEKAVTKPKPKAVSIESTLSEDEKLVGAEELAPSTTNGSQVEESVELVPEPSKPKVSVHPIPYHEPSWGGRPDSPYSLEVRSCNLE